jgi:membrane-bound metal-dependent hydrolase YbcI (DUF457 family)
MPQAVTHILIVIILLSIFRDYFVRNKKNFPLHYVLIGGLAGILPDLDVLAFYFLSFFGYTLNEVHRVFSHNLFFVFIFVILGFLMYGTKNSKLGKHHLKIRNLFFVISFGIFVHLLLDYLVSGSITPLYPLFDFNISLNLLNFIPNAWRSSFIPALDALLLVLWLIYLEMKHKISDFI